MTDSSEKSSAKGHKASGLEDGLLVRRFIEGDSAAFDEIVRKHSEIIANLVNRLLGWRGEVDDITQDVFMAAFLGLKKFRSDANLKTWLFTIAINKTKKYKAKMLMRNKHLRNIQTMVDYNSIDAVDKEISDKEKKQQIGLIISNLSYKYRQPIVLRYLYDFDISQISEVLGVSINVVNTRLSRAREKMKDSLSKKV